jgi:RNA polymerase-binding protein DksA
VSENTAIYHIVTTPKSVAEAARDLDAAVQKHRFGVLHVYDLKETLTRKGHPLAAECRIFEVCNPQHASQVLQRDMRVNMALPCRISVFEDGGVTKIGTILPTELLRMLSPDRELAETARAVEATLKAIVNDAAAPPPARQALERRRTTLAREIEAGVAKRMQARDGNVPDTAEIASDDLAHDVGLAEVDRDVVELEAIDAALARLDSGTYGRCLDCRAAIDPARLAKSPEATRCVPCQEKSERKGAARIARL